MISRVKQDDIHGLFKQSNSVDHGENRLTITNTFIWDSPWGEVGFETVLEVKRIYRTVAKMGRILKD